MLCKAQALRPDEGIIARDGGFAFALNDARTAWLGPANDLAPDPSELCRWRLADIEAGLPWLAPSLQEKFVPQALDLARIDALRLDKGCFPGQEIAARLHFRGGLKQRLHRVILRGAGEVCAGLRIDAGGILAGVVLYGASADGETSQALAVINDAATHGVKLVSAHAHEVLLRS
jgi:folate-binding protein YgfZ